MLWHSRLTLGTCVLLTAGNSAAFAKPLPTITKLTLSGSASHFSARITGKSFGASPVALPCQSCDIPELAVLDVGDINLSERPTITAWTNTSISLSGIAGNAGDAVWVSARNDSVANYAVWSGNLPGGHHPKIKSVGFSGSGASTTITIVGTGFGNPPPGVPGTTDIAYFELWPWVVDDQQSGNVPYSAGYTGQGYTDTVTLDYTYWSDTQIVVSGFGGGYGQNGYTFGSGDPYVVNVFKYSPKGPTEITGKGGRVP